MLLSKLKNTDDCIEIGKNLAEDEKAELSHCREICVKSSKKWLELQCWDIASIMAAKSQFCREAIEASEGTFNQQL